tara:strand:- start:207 stop:332 length:126 start_codon:yes stop_codon:yes gene_type:complete
MARSQQRASGKNQKSKAKEKEMMTDYYDELETGSGYGDGDG